MFTIDVIAKRLNVSAATVRREIKFLNSLWGAHRAPLQPEIENIMKTVNIKITDTTVTLGQPHAKPGYHPESNCTIESIHDVPDDIPSDEVFRRALQIVIIPRTESYSWNAIKDAKPGQIVRIP